MNPLNSQINNPHSRKRSVITKIRSMIANFSLTEKAIMLFLVIVLAISGISIVHNLNRQLKVEIPTRGGTLIEGIVGSPRYINPVIASSEADKDMSSLLHSGLMRNNREGELIPDLASSYTLSEDGLVYTFRLKDNIYFHDGTPVTARDVVYTISKIQDPMIRSPKRSNFEGIMVEEVNPREVTFILPEAYHPFLFNMTIGIIPYHIWSETDSEQFVLSSYNIEAVGSGPYKIRRLKRSSAGLPETYYLQSFEKFSLGQPYITNLEVRFFPNEESLVEAYKKGELDNISSLTSSLVESANSTSSTIRTAPLPRVFGVFFNHNQAPIFAAKEVRKALDKALDKELIVQEVLSGYGGPLYGPVPEEFLLNSKQQIAENRFLHKNESEVEEMDSGLVFNLKEASQILEDGGWKFDEEENVMKKTQSGNEDLVLNFTIATANNPELENAAEMIAQSWRNVGARVEVEIFDIGTLNQDVIRARRFDTLLFGKIIGRELDLYSFWHSSQRNDPGLNISSYANIAADRELEAMRKSINFEEKLTHYREFENILKEDIPAIFLYYPEFIYLSRQNISGMAIKRINAPSERFSNIHKWSLETEKVWKIFDQTNSSR